VRRLFALLALLTTALFVLVVAPGAAAGDTPCVGVLAGTHDNVVVPPGATCSLLGATVRGNVKALANSRLVIDNSTVHGDVDGDGADSVQVNNSTVDGNVTITGGGPAALPVPPGGLPCTVTTNVCEAAVGNTTVGGNVHILRMVGSVRVGSILMPAFGALFEFGNVQVEDNFIPAGDDLVIAFNTIPHNLQVYKNTGPGSKTVSNNTADTIQCFDNGPPFVGGPNAGVKEEGQCF
jgi:hypothetical protein